MLRIQENRWNLLMTVFITTFLPSSALRHAFSVLLTVTVIDIAVAADAPKSFDECQDVTDQTIRYRCYDRVESSSKTSSPPSDVTHSTIPARITTPIEPATAEAPTNSTQQRKDDMHNYGLQNKSKGQVQTTSEPRIEMVDTVASIKTISPNIRKITLNGGQVWRQSYTQRYMLKVGDTVSIRPSGWGQDYRLYSERLGGFAQVARVQ
jgi:hypothetical protein